MGTALRLLAIVVWCLLAASPAVAEKRVALVIGNNDYPSLGAGEQLQRAVNDANAVGDALAQLDFEVTRGENLSRGDMLKTLLATADQLEPGDLGFFFFAGHGVSIDGANYLLPSDIPPATSGAEELIKLSAVAESTVVSTLKGRGVRIAMVVIDACRNNPFSQGGTRAFGDAMRGLARPPALEMNGVFGLYSAGFGEQALDRLGDADDDPNSVFTRVLVPALSEPGESLLDIAYRVNEEVARLAGTVGHAQNPAYYDQARARDVYLGPQPEQQASGEVAEQRQGGGGSGGTSSCAGAQLHFEAAREIGTIAALEDHLQHFSQCEFGGLAEMLIGKIGGASEEQIAAIAPRDDDGAGAAAGIDPHAVAKAFVTAIVGDRNFEVAYESASRKDADVVVEGITASGGFFGGYAFRVPQAVIEAPSLLADGGFLSPRISLAKGEIEGTSTGGIDGIVITDFATIPQLTAGGGATAPGFSFGTIEATGIRLQDPSMSEALSLARLFVEAGDFVGNRPKNIRGRVERMSLPATAFAEAGLPLGDLGYAELVVDIVWDASFDFDSRTMTLRDLTVAVEDGGVLSLTAALRNVPELGMLLGSTGEAASANVGFQSLTLRYDDDSLATRFLDELARQQDKPRSELIEEMKTNLPESLTLDPGFELKLVQMLAAFMTEPRSFTFSMEPDTPLSIEDMLQIIAVAPDTLDDRLRVSITANSQQ